MKPDEVVNALRACNRTKGHRCSECPVLGRYNHRMCKSVVDKFAADHIESLQAEFAEYEDSNLTPAEVAELAQAKAEGRVVVLPCKVGDTVHVRSDTWGNTWNFKTIEHGKFLVGEIVSAIVTRKQTLIKIQVEHNVAWKRERKRYPISAIGKTVFLTREAAEKASKECEK